MLEADQLRAEAEGREIDLARTCSQLSSNAARDASTIVQAEANVKVAEEKVEKLGSLVEEGELKRQQLKETERKVIDLERTIEDLRQELESQKSCNDLSVAGKKALEDEIESLNTVILELKAKSKRTNLEVQNKVCGWDIVSWISALVFNVFS